MTQEAKIGDTVKVHYTGKLTDGEVFDSSHPRGEPLAFKLGEGQIIKGFEEAVLGMKVGESKTQTFPPELAYGEPRDELKFEFPKERLPEGMEPQVGQQLYMTTQSGQPAPVTVADVKDAAVVLDANHPLAGKELTFEIELLGIENA